MEEDECDRCEKLLDEADFKLNDRRYQEFTRRYPDAGISDNFGDRPNFEVLCAACIASHLQDEAERRTRETVLDVLAQGDSHPHFARYFFIVCIIIILLGALLISG
jgi:hypothetical protein